jgi:hypothetical protein
MHDRENSSVRRRLSELVAERRAKAALRRKRALERAIAEKRLADSQDGSIWRSGKGGAHHDR